MHGRVFKWVTFVFRLFDFAFRRLFLLWRLCLLDAPDWLNGIISLLAFWFASVYCC